MLEKSNKWTRVTRRNVLKGAVEAGGVWAATTLVGPQRVSGVGSIPINSPTQDDLRVDLTTLLNIAATVEALAATFYASVLGEATFFMEDADREHVRQISDAEAQHLDIWQTLGGRPQTGQFHLPLRLLTDASLFVDTGLMLEATSVGVYLAATQQLARLGQAQLAAVAAQHAASEAQHHTLLSRLAGLKPNHVALLPSFAQIVDAMSALKPFLEGGAGTMERWYVALPD